MFHRPGPDGVTNPDGVVVRQVACNGVLAADFRCANLRVKGQVAFRSQGYRHDASGRPSHRGGTRGTHDGGENLSLGNAAYLCDHLHLKVHS